MSQFFTSRGQSIGISSLASVPPMNTRTDLLQKGLVGSPCSPRDSQESSPTPQFKSINSLALSILDTPTLTFVYDYWKKHSFDYTDLCQHIHVSSGEGNGTPLQYSCLENPMDGRAW